MILYRYLNIDKGRVNMRVNIKDMFLLSLKKKKKNNEEETLSQPVNES